jgi:glycosyltransferase involved in cell wall biosynthesis
MNRAQRVAPTNQEPMSSPSSIPMVSVGLPVYNGENYVAEAIESVLAQTFGDLELVIHDNASTDRTAEICQAYAARDRRVLYFRNPRNLGAAPNYNLAWSRARGRYFKWLAHDDRMLPDYLASTVRRLEETPDAVVCNSVIRYIDEQGEPIGIYNSGLAKASVGSPAARFRSLVLQSHSCVDFFGLIRREAMTDSLRHGVFHGADRAFIAQMALRGRLLQIDYPISEMREHPLRYTRRQSTSTERRAWHDASHRNKITFPVWRLYREYLKMVGTAPLSTADRLRCYGVLAQWWFRNWNAVRAGVDLLAVFTPAAPGFAEAVKTRLFGAAPGHFIADRRR